MKKLARSRAFLESFPGRVVRFGDGVGTPVAWGFFVLIGIVFVLAYRSLGPGGWRGYSEFAVRPAGVLHDEGHAYLIPLRIAHSDASTSSTLEVYEDGRMLGPPHALHTEIRERGEGRYSHWINGIYFSASDNGDPRTNGRRYFVRYASRSPAGAVSQARAIGFAFCFVGCVVLNANRLGRLKRKIAGRLPIPPGRAYGAALGVVLIVAALCRASWIQTLQVPIVTNDSDSYLMPALEHPLFPLSETRPIAYPYAIALGLAAFRRPSGILIVQSCLALLAAVLFAVVLRRRFGIGLASLLIAVYLLFCSKNVSFEHFVMTEHLARTLYLLFCAILVGFWKLESHGLTLLLALISVAAILTKPSGIVLWPAFLGWAVMAGLMSAERSGGARRLVRAVGLYFGLSASLLIAYAAANSARFGFFGLSGMDGFVLYWHVHPLTRLDSGLYPEIKKELRTFFPQYLEAHAEKKDYLGNWAVWGSLPPGATTSPAAVVRAYAETHGEGSMARRQNEIFKALALEAIRYRPREYLALSLRGVRSLWEDGLGFWYRHELLSVDPPTPEQTAWFEDRFSAAGRARWIAVRGGPVRRFSLWSPPGVIADLVTTLMTRGFRIIAWSGLLFGLIALTASDGSRRRLIGVLPFAAVPVLYILFCGFLIPAEPPRLLAHVQDLIVAVPLILAGVGMGAVLRLASEVEEPVSVRQKKKRSRSRSRKRKRAASTP